jgi:hypothetical protein
MLILLYQNNKNGLLLLHASMLGEKIFPISILRMSRNYIVHYESNATMAMKPKARMDNQLFLNWIAHFVKSMISTMDRISLTN